MAKEYEKDPYFLIGRLDSILNWVQPGSKPETDSKRVRKAREALKEWDELRKGNHENQKTK